MYGADSENAKTGVPGLYLVKDYTSEGAPKLDALDVVAIHGINGHCVNSWTNAKSGTYWLRDLLPEKLPQARIMTFQYDAKVLGNKSTYGIRDIATQLLNELVQCRDGALQDRRIVFVAHSLGGIITKLALTQAGQGAIQSTSNIYENTKGIVFFGTPHRGSNLADWTTKISRLASAASLKPESKLAMALQLHSEELLKVSNDFRSLATRYAIVTFYEQHVHPIARTLIVDKMSAIIGVVHEDVLMLGGNHSSMCKFEPGDPRFDTAWWSIKKAAEGPSALRREGRRTLRIKEKKRRIGEM